MDLSTYQFLNSCMTSKASENVAFDMVSLRNKCFDIVQNCFIANKPAYLCCTRTAFDDSDSLNQSCPAKKLKQNGREKQNESQLGAVVRNSNFNNTWDCRQGYRRTFTREVIATTPPFNDAGTIVCNKWHTQGRCFEKCERRSTHRPFTDDTLKKNYAAWVKECKAMAK